MRNWVAILARRLRRRDVSAGLCVLGAAAMLLGPAAALVTAAARQLADLTAANASPALQSWEDVVSSLPAGPTIIGWIERHFDVEREWQRVSNELGARATSLVTGTLWSILRSSDTRAACTPCRCSLPSSAACS